MSNVVTMTKTHIDAAAAAKLIRADLKAAFPGVKFSVRISRFSMGSSIEVSYTNGPVRSAVEAIAESYGQATFDGQTDCKGYQAGKMVMTASGPVLYSCSAWVSVSRNYSDEARAAAVRNIALGWEPKHPLGRPTFDLSADEKAALLLSVSAL